MFDVGKVSLPQLSDRFLLFRTLTLGVIFAPLVFASVAWK